MTILSNIIVDSNTSVILADTSNLPDNNDIVVLLSTIVIPGRIVSVRDIFGNLSPTKRIIVSTTVGNKFFDNTSSVVLNQPFSFATVNNLTPTTWVLQNTFAFPQQAGAASITALTASYAVFSSIQAQGVFSTQTLQVSTLNVENVVAGRDVVGSNNLFLGDPFIKSFPTTGNASLGGAAYVSSFLDVGWDTTLRRNVTVLGDLNISSITNLIGRVSTAGDVLMGSSLTILGPTVTSSISSFGRIGFGNDIFLTRNTLNASNVNAGNSISTPVLNTQILSSGNRTFLNNVSTFGTAGFATDILMTNNTLFSQSTITNSLVASNSLFTQTANVSSISSFTTASLSTAILSGTLTIANQTTGLRFSTLVLQTSSVAATNTSTQTLISQILSNTGPATFAGFTQFTSNISSLSSIGLGAPLFMTNQTLFAGIVSTPTVVTSSLTAAGIFATSFLSTSQLNTSNISTNSINIRGLATISTIIGDGSQLFNLPAVSAPTLYSTVDGLGRIYVSTSASGLTLPVLVSSIEGLGNANYVSSSQLTSTTSGIQSLINSNTGFVTPGNVATGVSTAFLNVSNVTNFNFSTNGAGFLNLVGAFPGLGSNFTPIDLVNEEGSTRMLVSIRSGANNQMTLGVDGVGNAEIRSLPNNRLNLFANEIRITNSNNPTLFTQVLSNTVITSSLTVNSLAGIGVTIPFSTLALFTSNTSNFASNILQDWSTSLSTTALFTSNTSNFASNILRDWSTPVSTVALFTSNTSNWASNIQQNFSTFISTSAQYTSNTSNYFRNANPDFSTPLSTVAQFTSNTSNWASNIQQNFSTFISTSAQYTSNTSNYFRNANPDFSTPLSTVAQFTSNTSNWASNIQQNFSTFISTSAQYTSNTSNYFRNANPDFSTPLSTVAQFTSNTSNWASNIQQNFSTFISTTSLYTSNTSNYFRNANPDFSTPLSTVALFTSNTSNFASNIVQNWSVGQSTLSTLLFTSLTSTVQGLGRAGYVSTSQLFSTTTGIELFVSSFVTTYSANAYTGTVLYFNKTVTSGSNFTLENEGTTAVQQSTITSVPAGNGNTFLASFITDFSLPAFIPGGFWDMNLFAQGAAGGVTFVYARIYQVAAGGSSNLLVTSPISQAPTTNTQIGVTPYVPYTLLTTGDKIRIEFFGSNTSGTSQNITLYWEGQNYSHIHTTFGTLIPDTVLGSTLNGLGTAGYISTAQFNALSNSFKGANPDFSTAISSVALYTSNTSNYSRNILQNWSTPLSTVAEFTSNTSNFASNILQNWSTAVSTTALFTSNTSNFVTGFAQNWSTPLSTVGLFTSNTSNFARNILQNWSTATSTVAQFTSNTSNFASGFAQNWSTPVSTVALFTSNTSNFFRNANQDFSTPISTVSLFTSNTSNFFRGGNPDFSTPLSTVALFTSNTSNFFRNANPNFSTSVSSVALFTSNTSNFASNILQNWSTAVSTTALFTSNTSNWAAGALQNWSTAVSTTALFTSNTSNFLVANPAPTPYAYYQFIGLVQGIPISAVGSQTTFTATSNYQTYTVPSGTNYLFVVAWGAGGGSYNGYNAPPGLGGGGACVKGYLPVNGGETLRIIVGVGGLNDQSGTNPTDAMGGGGQGRGGGGGRTAIQRVNGTDLFVVGGGGGGGIFNGDVGGAATASGIAWRGNNGARSTASAGSSGGSGHGGGGSQTQGGSGFPTGTGGTQGKGGGGNAGAGGGGWWGGGAAYYNGGFTACSGGGGSSMTSNLIAFGLQLFDASGATAANNSDTLRASTYGTGRDYLAQGGHGVLYITPFS